MSRAQAVAPAEDLPARVGRWLQRVEDSILVVLLVTIVGLALSQIVLRNVAATGITWADPLARVLVLWLGLAGALAATRDDRQITVDVLSRFMPARRKAAARVLTDLFTAVVSALVSWHAARLVLEDRAAGATAFGTIPVWLCELVLPVAFALIAARYLLHAVRHLRESLGRESE